MQTGRALFDIADFQLLIGFRSSRKVEQRETSAFSIEFARRATSPREDFALSLIIRESTMESRCKKKKRIVNLPNDDQELIQSIQCTFFHLRRSMKDTDLEFSIEHGALLC